MNLIVFKSTSTFFLINVKKTAPEKPVSDEFTQAI